MDQLLPTFTRRDFAKHLTVGGVIGASAGLFGVAVEDSAASLQDEPEPRRPPSLSALVLAQIVRQYPSDKYTEDVLDGLLGDIRQDLARGRELGKTLLNNADEPAFAFSVFRGDRPRLGSRPQGQAQP